MASRIAVVIIAAVLVAVLRGAVFVVGREEWDSDAAHTCQFHHTTTAAIFIVIIIFIFIAFARGPFGIGSRLVALLAKVKFFIASIVLHEHPHPIAHTQLSFSFTWPLRVQGLQVQVKRKMALALEYREVVRVGACPVRTLPPSE
jgi:hypothetical protein